VNLTVYSNSTPQGLTHHRLLSEILDRYTIPRMIGLQRNFSGMRCLEVGAGFGSIAAWLAGEVGDRGLVVATDKEPMPIPAARRLRHLRHDITTEPVPDPPYDMIHARLVLVHLPEREQVLQALANALTPNGVLIVEDWDLTWRTRRALRMPSEADSDLYDFFQNCLSAVMVAAGADPAWPSRTLPAMVDAGLTDVESEIYSRSCAGGSAGCQLVAGTVGRLREQLLKQGLTPQDLDRIQQLMASPQTYIRLPPFWSTVGYRP
jgi:SAM-dependent methyltransferase